MYEEVVLQFYTVAWGTTRYILYLISGKESGVISYGDNN